MAAVKAGADLVRIAVPRGIANVIAKVSPDLIVERLDTLHPYELGPEVIVHLRRSMEWCHCVVIGPGSGRARPSLHLLIDLIRTARDLGKPVVMDADAITAVASYWQQGEKQLDPMRALLTPHRGELARLVYDLVGDADLSILSEPYEGKGPSARWKKEGLELVSNLQKVTGATLLVKGPVDLISSSSAPSLSSHVEIETEAAL
jgi:NAD(P)H-hydrate epimerase